MTGFEHIRLSYVVPVYMNQKNGGLVQALLSSYSRYPRDLMKQIQFVVVDDCSRIPVELSEDIDLNVLLMRVSEDIPWNQPGARNLGVVYARSEKIIVTDIDHEFPEKTLEYIVKMKCPSRHMYLLDRFEDGKKINRHLNTFILCRSSFLKYFGYDEEFCGAYGQDDILFREWQRLNGTRFFNLPSRFHCIHRVVDRNKSYHSLQRDRSKNLLLASQKRFQWDLYGYWGGHSRRFLNFTWKIVADRRMTGNITEREISRWWRPMWPLRWIFGA